jgi:LysR family glycine cleavage system transcriptional activator
MLRRAPPLRDLRAFCVAARLSSFSGAAEVLCVTPSAISHLIRDLEQQVGTKLFARKTRAIELTATGRALLQEVEPLLAAIDRAVSRASTSQIQPTLRLAMPQLFASELFLPRLAQYRAARRSVDIDLKTLESNEAHTDAVDVSILLVSSKPMGLETWQLFRQQLVAAAAPAVVAQPVHIEQLYEEAALIVHTSRPDAWSHWAEKSGLRPAKRHRIIELDSMHAVVRAAEEGVGIALVPSRLCRERFARSSLLQLSPIQIDTRDAYYLAHRREDGMRTEVRALTSWLLSEFRSSAQAA